MKKWIKKFISVTVATTLFISLGTYALSGMLPHVKAEKENIPDIYYDFSENAEKGGRVVNKGKRADSDARLFGNAEVRHGAADLTNGGYVRLPDDLWRDTEEFTLSIDYSRESLQNNDCLFLATKDGLNMNEIGNTYRTEIFLSYNERACLERNIAFGTYEDNVAEKNRHYLWERPGVNVESNVITLVYDRGNLKTYFGEFLFKEENFEFDKKEMSVDNTFNAIGYGWGWGRTGFKGKINSVCYYGEAKTLSEAYEGMGYTLLDFDFKSSCDYQLQKPVYGATNTFEATVKYPSVKFFGRTGGCIFGSYDLGVHEHGTNYEVNLLGNPVVVWDNGAVLAVFDQIDLRTDEWTHLAIVRDETASEFRAYVNGEFKQSVAGIGKRVSALVAPSIGNDARHYNGDDNAFKGEIGKVAVYGESRSPSQIAKDAEEMTPDASNPYLIGFWDVTGLPLRSEDESKNENTAVRSSRSTYFDGEFTVYDYTFALIPDTQYLVRHKEQDLYATFDWLVANKDSLNLEFLMAMGDLQDNADGLSEPAKTGEIHRQFSIVKNAYDRLKGVLPYSTVLGNHDYDEGSGILSRSTKFYNSTFSKSDYAYFYSSYDDSVDNVAHKFEVGNEKWIVLALEYYPRNEVLAWASEICENNSDCRVIVTTHAFQNSNGSYIEYESGYYAMNDGDSNGAESLWNKFLKRHKNIYMIASGHTGDETLPVSTRRGDHGNEVIHVRCNAQDAMDNRQSLVCLLSFKDNGRTVAVNYYSPIKNQFFNYQNQFTFTADVPLLTVEEK